jgi:hypothetical protein
MPFIIYILSLITLPHEIKNLGLRSIAFQLHPLADIGDTTMFLRFLKRHKFVVEKEVLFGHGALNLNPIPPNLTGVDAIATQLDSQDTLYDS